MRATCLPFAKSFDSGTRSVIRRRRWWRSPDFTVAAHSVTINWKVRSRCGARAAEAWLTTVHRRTSARHEGAKSISIWNSATHGRRHDDSMAVYTCSSVNPVKVPDPVGLSDAA